MKTSKKKQLISLYKRLGGEDYVEDSLIDSVK